LSTVIFTKIILLLLLLICSGFFSGSETSLFSLGRIERHRIREEGETLSSRWIQSLLQRPKRLIITILIGNELINIIISALAASFTEDIITISGYTEASEWLFFKTLAATAICLPLLLIFGEITPKTLALKNPHRFSLFVAIPLSLFYRMVTPVRWILAGLADVIVRFLFGEQPVKEEPITEREFRNLVDMSKKGGVLWDSEHEFIHNIFDFGETRVSEIMTPRTDMFCIQSGQSLEEALQIIEQHHYSRIPVYEKDKDDIIGILYSKDLLRVGLDFGRQKDWTLDVILRQPYFIPQTKMASDLFREFRSTRIHLAIVVDEYGGVAGLVTMEDLLEDLFGEILDEYDPEEPQVRQVDKNTMIIPARMSIEEFNKRLNVEFPEDEYDTMGGLIFDLFGRLPASDAKISYKHYTFTVEKMLGTRILELKVQWQDEVPEAPVPAGTEPSSPMEGEQKD